MKTGKHNFNKYAIIWAKKILNKEEGYSLLKAREIDSLFGELVESRLKELKQYEQSKERIKTAWAYALVIANKWLAEESKKLAEMTIETDLAMNNLKSGNVNPETIQDTITKINALAEQEIKTATVEATRDVIKIADENDLTQSQVTNVINQAAEEVKSSLDKEWEAIQHKVDDMTPEEIEKALEEIWGKGND